MVDSLDFDWVLGVDQCGAIDSKKHPKPLHSVIFSRSRASVALFEQGRLKSLSYSHLSQSFLTFEDKKAIVADCVLGLPESVKSLSFDLMKSSWDFDEYGLHKGKEFFETISNEKLKRVVEKLVGAHTVFSPYPSQRNIQTGTYRIWRDLTENCDQAWFNLWPYNWNLEKKTDQLDQRKCTLFEAYPSFTLKHLMKVNSADEFVALFPELNWEAELLKMIDKSKDIRDATSNALLPYFLKRNSSEKQSLNYPTIAIKEGWILGVVDG